MTAIEILESRKMTRSKETAHLRNRIEELKGDIRDMEEQIHLNATEIKNIETAVQSLKGDT